MNQFTEDVRFCANTERRPQVRKGREAFEEYLAESMSELFTWSGTAATFLDHMAERWAASVYGAEMVERGLEELESAEIEAKRLDMSERRAG